MTDTPDVVDLIGRAGAGARRVAGAIGADDWHKPTPCTEYDVQDLFAHFTGSLQRIPLMALGEKVDWSQPVELGPDPLATFGAAVEDNVRFWSEGDHASLSMGPMSLSGLNLTEVVVHTWDLARGTGQAPALDPDVVQGAWEWARSVPAEMRGQGTSFGPPVEVADTAPTLDRLVGLLGRTP